jgi:predicted RNA-binding Zn-ribbon protein involved in translation (DUF1610 family)
MSEVKAFFRHCPACGRRFHIRIVSKNIAGEITERVNVKEAGGAPVLIVEDTEPVTIDVQEFNYAYKCKHCGHEWSEVHE